MLIIPYVQFEEETQTGKLSLLDKAMSKFPRMSLKSGQQSTYQHTPHKSMEYYQLGEVKTPTTVDEIGFLKERMSSIFRTQANNIYDDMPPAAFAALNSEHQMKKRLQSYTDTFVNTKFSNTLIVNHFDTVNEVDYSVLSSFEKKEIKGYSSVYFIGSQASKDARQMHTLLRAKQNNGFDTEGRFYKVVIGDHIDYRYEVLQEIDKGSFG